MISLYKNKLRTANTRAQIRFLTIKSLLYYKFNIKENKTGNIVTVKSFQHK